MHRVFDLQIAEGDVCRNFPVPLYMIFPRLFTCPTLATDNFKVGTYSSPEKSIINNMGCKYLYAGFETCFDWNPQLLSVLGSDSKMQLKMKIVRHFERGSDAIICDLLASRVKELFLQPFLQPCLQLCLQPCLRWLGRNASMRNPVLVGLAHHCCARGLLSGLLCAEFEVNVVIVLQTGDLITENFPIKLVRA